MKPAIFLALAMTASAAQADDFSGLSIGVDGSLWGQVTMDVTQNGYAKENTAQHFGAHVRYLWKAEGSNWHMGVEGRAFKINATAKAGKYQKLETFKYGLDGSALIGYQTGRCLPHGVFGASHSESDRHGSNGFHYGAGVMCKVHENILVTVRYTHREFDDPYRGSDGGDDALDLMLSWKF